MLGYRCLQYPVVMDPIRFTSADFICDKPVNYRFVEADGLFPGSRFILTLRPIEAWLRSQEAVFAQGRPGDPITTLRKECYGIEHFDRRVYGQVYKRHEERVLKYFRDRMDRLLVFNIFEGDGWKELISFVKPEFPHMNRRG